MLTRSLLAAASAAVLPFLATAQTTACNNSPDLCNRAYNNITMLGVHDSPFLRDESTSFSTSGNQYYNSTVQLNSGARLLTAQVHKKNNTAGDEAWHLCHSICDLLDAGTLSSWLGEIKTWMDANPNDVVTVLLVNSDNATPADLGAQFQSAGIDKYAYTPPSTSSVPQTWPTLQSLISNGTRLMTFVASLSTPSADFPYLMDEFTFIFENDFENESPSNYSCTPDRPTSLTTTSQAASSGKMFLMNHFLYSTQLFGIETPNSTYVNVTNSQNLGTGALGSQIETCAQTYSKAPWAVLVDFFNVGPQPAIEQVDRANGITAIGRTPAPEEALSEIVSGVSKQQQNLFAVVLAVVVAIGFGM